MNPLALVLPGVLRPRPAERRMSWGHRMYILCRLDPSWLLLSSSQGCCIVLPWLSPRLNSLIYPSTPSIVPSVTLIGGGGGGGGGGSGGGGEDGLYHFWSLELEHRRLSTGHKPPLTGIDVAIP